MLVFAYVLKEKSVADSGADPGADPGKNKKSAEFCSARRRKKVYLLSTFAKHFWYAFLVSMSTDIYIYIYTYIYKISAACFAAP